MTRSRRKSPFTGYTCVESEKKDKQLAHRRFRAVVRDRMGKIRDRLNKNHDLLEESPNLPQSLDEVSDTYTFGKDGKQMVTKSSPYYEKAMRK